MSKSLPELTSGELSALRRLANLWTREPHGRKGVPHDWPKIFAKFEPLLVKVRARITAPVRVYRSEDISEGPEQYGRHTAWSVQKSHAEDWDGGHKIVTQEARPEDIAFSLPHLNRALVKAGIKPIEDHQQEVVMKPHSPDAHKDITRKRLARPAGDGVSRIAEDARIYRKSVRPLYAGRKLTPEQEGRLMHQHLINRGLKVVKGDVPQYAAAEHVFVHPTPENPAAVAHSYFGLMRGAVKLARVEGRVNDYGAANAMGGSEQHKKRLEIARDILNEAGLKPADVRNAMAHDHAGARASVVQIIKRASNPEHTRYAAAWRGLLLNEPGVSVFHPDSEGSDTLHIVSSPHPPDYIAGKLRDAGVPRFTTEKTATGTRAYVLNPPTEFVGSVPDARHSVVRGVGYRIGSGSSTSAPSGQSATAGDRAAYRTVIDDFERSARDGSAPEA